MNICRWLLSRNIRRQRLPFKKGNRKLILSKILKWIVSIFCELMKMTKNLRICDNVWRILVIPHEKLWIISSFIWNHTVICFKCLHILNIWKQILRTQGTAADVVGGRSSNYSCSNSKVKAIAFGCDTFCKWFID